jgi:hypothetical protein
VLSARRSRELRNIFDAGRKLNAHGGPSQLQRDALCAAVASLVRIERVYVALELPELLAAIRACFHLPTFEHVRDRAIVEIHLATAFASTRSAQRRSRRWTGSPAASRS